MIALRWILHAFPFLHNVLPFLLPVLAKVDPLLKAVGIFMGHIEAQIDEILRDPAALDRAEHEIVYHHLLTSQVDKGRREMPTRKALIEEARALTIAGSDTVAATSTVGVFHVLSNKQVLSTLMKELEEAWPEKDSRLSYEVLEKLPYLVNFLDPINLY
jgi:cytochrome P450